MTRVNTRAELLKSVTEVGVFRDTSGGGSSTSTGTQPTVDAKSVINVVSGTNFLAGDWFRVGALTGKPFINRVESIATNAITPPTPRMPKLGVSTSATSRPMPSSSSASPA